MSFLKENEQYIKNNILKIGYNIDHVVLERTSRPDLGEFQLNICMNLAKKYKENPIEIANKIINTFDDRFTNVNIAGPGFINLSINDNILSKEMNNSINDFNKFIDKEESKKIIIDYGGANVAKSLHVGHMRSANIGQALKNLASAFGNNVIGDVHLGDLGRQSGMVISELKKRKPMLPYFDSNNNDYPKYTITLQELNEYYPCASKSAKEDENRMKEVRDISAIIDKGIEPYFSLWKDIVEVSIEDIKKIYSYLNCDFELWEGEMSSFRFMKETLSHLEPYCYESEGAKVIDVKNEDDEFEMPPLIVIKSDGATIYATRDLATLYGREKEHKPDEIWYVIDQRQSLYLKQIFRASYKTKLVRDIVNLEHYGFGTMNGKDGKPFKTRDGGVLELDTLIKLVKEEISKKILENNDEVDPKTADILTVAAIKYADLLPYRTTDYIFDIEKFCSFEGKTGPYILYTMVRIKSILNKININDYEINSINSSTEKDIYLKVLELSKVLKKSYEEKVTSYMCEYLFNICSLFNKFYSECNIINEKDENKKSSYIGILHLVYNIVEKLLDILAIKIPDRM